ncbi:MAG: beta-ketoacyl-[acyl-carrier-protein] synthase family protein [Bacteroidales bacterium]|jgi:3-oxoacyl-[acyl-carrier-protein] synthase-1|nr:beta-ketoacyl-[acyl-carrier-protein] synthase family protein [Bacteroidales bacterium]
MNIYVTGIGIVSGIGMNTGETIASIREGKTGIGRLTLFDSVHQDTVPVSEVKRSNIALQELLGLPEKNVFSRTALLGMMATGEALKDAGVTVEEKRDTVLVSSTSVGGMDLSEGYYRQMKENERKTRLRNIISHDGGDSTGKIAAYHGLNPMATTISTACSSAANAIMFGAGLIRQGYTERVIAGGTDALTLFTINGFRSLMILDPDPCRPFDDTRSGLNLGEGAGYIVMESEQALMRKGKQPYCRLSGYGNVNDAFHQTASSPEGNGPFLAMKKALEQSTLSPEQIAYINVHGTGTPNNDLSEGRAIERLFQESVPRFSSTKAFTGHTLGAAGGIEAVLSVLSLKHGLIYPNLNFAYPMHDLRIAPEKALSTSFPVHHVLSNSFGFGGNCSSLVFSV